MPGRMPGRMRRADVSEPPADNLDMKLRLAADRVLRALETAL